MLSSKPYILPQKLYIDAGKVVTYLLKEGGEVEGRRARANYGPITRIYVGVWEGLSFVHDTWLIQLMRRNRA